MFPGKVCLWLSSYDADGQLRCKNRLWVSGREDFIPFASKDSISGNAPLRAFLTDRYQKRFPVLADCRHCINILYNSVPLSLHGKAWLGPEGLYQNTVLKRLSFTIEDERSTQRTAEFFLSLSKETKAGGSPSAPPFKDYTTGHEKRGVE